MTLSYTGKILFLHNVVEVMHQSIPGINILPPPGGNPGKFFGVVISPASGQTFSARFSGKIEPAP